MSTLQHSRPTVNVVKRPHAGAGGAGYAIPVAAALIERMSTLQHYRPTMNVVKRPHAGAGGTGYAIPLLAALIERSE